MFIWFYVFKPIIMKNLKRTILLLYVLVLSNISFDQIWNDLEIYPENGEKFTLYINWEELNKESASRLKVLNTEYDFVNVKIVFEDKSKKSLEKKMVIAYNPSSETIIESYDPVFIITSKRNESKLKVVSRSPKKIQSDNRVIIIEDE